MISFERRVMGVSALAFAVAAGAVMLDGCAAKSSNIGPSPSCTGEARAGAWALTPDEKRQLDMHPTWRDAHMVDALRWQEISLNVYLEPNNETKTAKMNNLLTDEAKRYAADMGLPEHQHTYGPDSDPKQIGLIVIEGMVPPKC